MTLNTKSSWVESIRKGSSRRRRYGAVVLDPTQPITNRGFGFRGTGLNRCASTGVEMIVTFGFSRRAHSAKYSFAVVIAAALVAVSATRDDGRSHAQPLFAGWIGPRKIASSKSYT